MKEKKLPKKKTAKKKQARKVRKPDAHILPKLEPEKPKEPEYTVERVLGYVVATREKTNFCLVSVRGNASPVACTLPYNRVNMATLKGKTIEMEQFTRDGKKYFRHISLSGTGIWHGTNPTK